MELLVVLVAEFITYLAIPVITLVIIPVAGMLSLLCYTVFGISRRRKPSHDEKLPIDQAARMLEDLETQEGGPNLIVSLTRVFGSKLLLVGAGFFGAVFAVCAVLVIVVNYFYLAPTLTWMAGKINEQGGIELSFADVKGDMISGNLTFKNLEVRRRSTDKTQYAFEVNSVDMGVNVFSLAFGDVQFSRLTLDGVTGDIWTRVRKGNAAKIVSARRHFEIRSLSLSDVEIGMHRNDTPSIALAIDTLKTERFTSRYVVFDAFFRSDISGKINGKEIHIASARKVDGRSTRWRLLDFPAELVGHYTNKAPFKWFEEGLVDVTVEDSWTSLDRAEIDTTWQVVLKGVKIVEPSNKTVIERAVGSPLARYVNSQEEDINLRLRFVMDPEQFKLKPSLNAAGLWDAVLAGTARTIAENSKETADEINQHLRKSFGSLKEFINDRRKKK